jgi:hypothetical protein
MRKSRSQTTSKAEYDVKVKLLHEHAHALMVKYSSTTGREDACDQLYQLNANRTTQRPAVEGAVGAYQHSREL